tara:strand:- start:1286 stop:2065 length:780 start_codon:yes stop_codon:yes gene_type:complete
MFYQCRYFEAEKENSYLVLTVTSKTNPLNNLSDDFSDHFKECILNAAKEEDLKAIILTGKGPVFSAGAFLPELMEQDEEGANRLAQKGADIWGLMESIPLITLAAVNGLCFGGGLELSLCCDFRIASTRAKFGQTEVNLGLIPGWGGGQRLVNLLGRTKALDLVLSGRQFRADEAFELGLVQKVSKPKELLEDAKTFLTPYISKNRETIALAKKSVGLQLKISQQDALKEEPALFGRSWTLKETKKTINDFVNKNPPKK